MLPYTSVSSDTAKTRRSIGVIYKKQWIWQAEEPKFLQDALENMILVKSGILPKLIERALQESPSDDWERELDEL